MPNYVQNILSFDGDQDQVSRLFESMIFSMASSFTKPSM